jgi:hypothetical protein
MIAPALAFALLCQTAGTSPALTPAAPAPATAAPPPEGVEAASAEGLPPPPPPSPPSPERSGPRRYGDQGTSEIALGLGYSSQAGFLAAGAFRTFVVAGVAPGLEALYLGGGKLSPAFGLLLGNLRLVPVRADAFALVVTARAGRVFLADHDDGWAAGGSAGIIVFLGPQVGLEVGYEALKLLPGSFCADLDRCVIHGPVFGLRIVL